MKRNYVINYFCGLLAVILLIIGIGVFFINVRSPKQAQWLESTDISTAEPLEYYSGEFLIVDVYAYTGESVQRSTDYFCYALVKDKYNNTQAVSLSITDADSYFAAVKEYACNEEAEIGDLIIECTAKAQRISAYPDYINRWFADAGDTYNEMIGISVSLPTNFEYYSTPGEFADTRRSEQRTMLVISTVCTAAGAVFAFLTFLLPGIKVHTAPRLTVDPNGKTENAEATNETNE